ncbi:SAUR-like auxin-responsive protein family [Euphorbia peplus]|nr:SAUR-like auxin-responsive protein family [Euphorbia peplus]
MNISAKKLIKMARKWQKLAALKRRRITSESYITATTDTRSCSTSAKAEKGFFAVYSSDQKRFLLPLEYLNNGIIIELFNMAEDEFGLPGSGPLTLPCEAEIMEYAIGLIKRQVNGDVERALLTSIANSCSSLPFHLQHQLPICSF